VWTITATNPSSGTAYSTQISGFFLAQVRREDAHVGEEQPCKPTVTPPSSYPVALGDIPSSGTARASFTIDFSGCQVSARFMLWIPWSSAKYETGTLVLRHQHP
jgi:hypothetical protein